MICFSGSVNMRIAGDRLLYILDELNIWDPLTVIKKFNLSLIE